MRWIYLLFLLSLTQYCYGQMLSGPALLDKAIKYHDPHDSWSTFNNKLQVTMSMPDKEDRVSDISINLPAESFQIITTKEDTRTTQTLDKDVCHYTLNGEQNISQEDLEKHRLNCDRTKLLRNYYTYLYGLPMKLKDRGTIVDPIVQEKEFKGKTYKVLKVTYEQEVGKDTWYFYFDPETYAMEIYQFFKVEADNDGEYILLSDEEVISGIKMPKTRAWYYNKEDKYLGTDVLSAQH